MLIGFVLINALPWMLSGWSSNLGSRLRREGIGSGSIENEVIKLADNLLSNCMKWMFKIIPSPFMYFLCLRVKCTIEYV